MASDVQRATGAAFARLTQSDSPITTPAEHTLTVLMLLCVEPSRISAVADELATIRGVTEAYSVAGRYDLAVIVRVKESDQAVSVVTDRIRRIADVQQSETLVAFRVHATCDLQSAFSGDEKAPS